MSLEIKKLTPALGAEIYGLDLSADNDPGTIDQIYQALLDNLVIFIPGQSLSPAQQLQFASQFGEIDKPHPIYPHADDKGQVTLLENDAERPPDTNDWHTDLTFKSDPPFASILYAVEVPESGGDTLWSSLYAAYEALPDDIKTFFADKSAVHDMGDFRNTYLAQDNPEAALNEAMVKLGHGVHPVVKYHPITQKPYLYVNPSFTRYIAGMQWSESERWMKYLFEHQDQPEYQIRYKWSKGTVAMWDNRCTMHYAVADYLPHYRRMHRVTVVKDKHELLQAA